jgi:hypothetical protein
MASRLPLSVDRRFRADGWARIQRRFSQWKALGWKLALWRLLWLPYSLGGEVPAPWLPERASGDGAAPSPAAREAVHALDGIRRRVWLNLILACIVRSLWLPFIAGIAIAAIQLLRDRDWSPQPLVWIWAVTVPLGLVLALLQRPGRWRTAWMLDHTFNLRDRMTTAIEAADQPAPSRPGGAPMNYLQLADAANIAHGLRADPRFRIHPPAREVSLAILTGLLFMALLFARGVGGSLAELADVNVPAFVPAAERRTAAGSTESPADPNERPPSVAEVQAKADKSNTTRDDLNTVADALDANALTQPAADAIRSGDYSTAAQSLRDIAQQADDMSPQARSDLADSLDNAAAATSDSSPSLSNAASEAADGLREGGDAAEEGVRDLGDAVDLAGDSVVPQEELASEMDQAQQSDSGQSQGADASSAATDAAQTGQQQPGANSSESGAQSGSQSDPTGADAAPGQASDGQPSDQSSEQQSPGDQSGNAESQGQQPADSPSGANQNSGGSQSGQANSGQSDSSGEASQGQAEGAGNGDIENGDNGPAAINSDPRNSANSSSARSGGGAGGESQENPDATKQAGSTGSGQNGESSEAPPTATSISAEPTASAPGTQPTAVPSQSVSLDGDGDDSIQLGGGSSASSLGSGAGVMVAGGDATQEAVPTAAPDNNRVPEDYRDIVEQYFSRDGD